MLQETRQRTLQTIQEFPVGCSEAKWQTQIHKYTTSAYRSHTHAYTQSSPPTPTPSHTHAYTQSHPHLHPVTPTPTPCHTHTYTQSHPHLHTQTPTPTPTSSHTHTYTQSHPHLHTQTHTPTPTSSHTHTYTQSYTLQLADADLKRVLSPPRVQVGTGLPHSARLLKHGRGLC